MRADDEASLATRPAKDHRATPQMLCGRWLDEAAEVGLPVGRDLDASVCWRDPPGQPVGFDEIARRLVDEETGLCAHDARFAEHDVIEHIAALAAGRLTVEEIVALSDRFLASDLVCRLTPKATGSGWEPPRWSTVAQRRLEDDTLVLLDRLADVPCQRRSPTSIVDAALATAGLGADQAAAVRTLCGPGGAVRAVLAPAGYGKTAMAHVAAGCAAADGRPVVAVATTAKAVAELDAAGLPARTIAAFRLDLRARPTARRDGGGARRDLPDLDPRRPHRPRRRRRLPGRQLWILGDPHQAPAVKAGGIAAEIAARAAAGSLPAAELTVNRRQVDPVDRHALDVLRGGDPHASQKVRREHGWEHTRRNTRGDTRGDGRRRRRLTSSVTAPSTPSRSSCPTLKPRTSPTGSDLGSPRPVCSTARRSADRAGRQTASTRPATGSCCTPATATAALRWSTAPSARSPPSTAAGSRSFPTTASRRVLPPAFVAGTRADGSPNVSHAWARTVDGAQGGTWDHAHLLGTAALDAYRGYTAQSRSRQPTHTWNTATVPTVDFGGRLAHQPDPDDQVAAALARTPDTTMAAVDDPWIVDRQLRQTIAAHQAELDRQPPDRQYALRDGASRPRIRPSEAGRRRPRRHRPHASSSTTSARSTGLTRDGRARRRRLEDELNQPAGGGDRRRRRGRPSRRPSRPAHPRASRPRRTRTLPRLASRRDRAGVTSASISTGPTSPSPASASTNPSPTASSRYASPTDTSTSNSPRSTRRIPVDRSRDLDAARRAPHQRRPAPRRSRARRRRAAGRARPAQPVAAGHGATVTRSGDARQQLDSARDHLADQMTVETAARQRLDDIEQHQIGPRRRALSNRRRTTPPLTRDRPDRRRTRPNPPRTRPANSPTTPAQLHLDVLGPVPTSPAGRAVWCHQASELEHHRDFNGDDDRRMATTRRRPRRHAAARRRSPSATSPCARSAPTKTPGGTSPTSPSKSANHSSSTHLALPRSNSTSEPETVPKTAEAAPQSRGGGAFRVNTVWTPDVGGPAHHVGQVVHDERAGGH